MTEITESQRSYNDTERKIVEAGFNTILRFGETKTSIGDVADAAGVSRGTIYRYFQDREGLLSAVMDHTNAVYWDTVDARIKDGMTLAEKIYSRARTSIRYSRAVTTDLLSGSVEMYELMMSEDVDRTFELSVEHTIPWLETARERGEIRDDIDLKLAADWISRVMLGLIWLPVSTVVDMADDKKAAAYARDMLMMGLAP